jgi:hypothetical protein
MENSKTWKKDLFQQICRILKARARHDFHDICESIVKKTGKRIRFDTHFETSSITQHQI